jgi:hypothetical protein
LGKIEPELRRTELEPGKTELRSGKEKPVLGKQNRDRVMDVGYGKSWNRFQVKKKMRNQLLRKASQLRTKKMRNQLLRNWAEIKSKIKDQVELESK